jgi:hypothetical protein
MMHGRRQPSLQLLVAGDETERLRARNRLSDMITKKDLARLQALVPASKLQLLAEAIHNGVDTPSLLGIVQVRQQPSWMFI